MSKADLADLLKKFYTETRREDGELYKTGSLINLRAGVNRFLKNSGKAIDIIEEPEFTDGNVAFQSTLVKLKRVGKGNTVHYSQVDESYLAKIYSFNVFDTSTPQGLQYKVWFELMIYICRRGRKNLRKLTKNHFAIRAYANGRRYVYQAKDEMTKKIREENMKSSRTHVRNQH